MFDIDSLPSSKAVPVNGISLTNKDFEFTYTASVDEKKLYKDISMRLIALEKSQDVNKKELEAINHMVEGFQIAIDEKEEILLRIDWLHRLYKVKEEIEFVDTKEKVYALQTVIATVQTCPMKNELMAELNSLEQSLPSGVEDSEMLSSEQLLMEKAIEEAGDVFINLGKAGREFVIADVLNQFGDDSSIANVKECAIALEKRVESLSEVSERIELITHLEQLPLPTFTVLEAERKEKIMDHLIETSKWNGLTSLDRNIAQLDKAITKEELEQYEKENAIILSNGNKAAETIDAESL